MKQISKPLGFAQLIFFCALLGIVLLPSAVGAQTILLDDGGSTDITGQTVDEVEPGQVIYSIDQLSPEEYQDYVRYTRVMAGTNGPSDLGFYILNLTEHTDGIDENGYTLVEIDGVEYPVKTFDDAYFKVEYNNGRMSETEDLSEYVVDPEAFALLRMAPDGQSVEYIVQKLINPLDPENTDFVLAFIFPDHSLGKKIVEDHQEMSAVAEVYLAENDRFGDYGYHNLHKMSIWWATRYSDYFVTDDRRGDPDGDGIMGNEVVAWCYRDAAEYSSSFVNSDD